VWGPFTLDLAAAAWNAQCERFYSKAQDGLRQRWRGRCWLNPPYSRGQLLKWTQKARASVLRGSAELVCLLVPSYTSERWFQDVVRLAPPDCWLVEGLEVPGLGAGFRRVGPRLTIDEVAIDGRLRFSHRTGKADSARHASCIVVFSQTPQFVDLDELRWLDRHSSQRRAGHGGSSFQLSLAPSRRSFAAGSPTTQHEGRAPWQGSRRFLARSAR
jgi:hypothetical protein